MKQEPSAAEAEKKDALAQFLAVLNSSTPQMAHLRHRCAAFLFDFCLIGFIAVTLLAKWILPQQYGNEWLQVQAFFYHYGTQGWMSLIQMPSFQKMAIDINVFLLILFWSYFVLSELFMNGASLGKRIFRLTVVKLHQLEPMGVVDVLWRNLMKSFFMFSFFPICCVNFLLAFFTKYRQAGHDFLAKTVVVYEPSIDLQDKPKN